MNFADFAAVHGLIIESLEVGRWVRVPTTDHPRSKNGAFYFSGDFGVVQNWATMETHDIWQDGKQRTPFEQQDMQKRMDASRAQYAEDRAAAQRKAASKAQWILGQCEIEQHAYLDSKGWGDTGLVWYPSEGVNLLVIPMRIAGSLAGCQLIDRTGNKKFLKGQRTNGAEYVFGARGIDVWCEGYATARSISECLTMAGLPARVHACFSAGNLTRMAKTGVVIADNDASLTGQKAAHGTGLPYYLPEIEGEDFNDEWRRLGTFAAGMKLRQWLQKARHESSAIRA